jgi:hypothetical protein
VGAILIGLPLAGVILLAIAATALSHMFDVKERKHLDPIPISASACPYVVAMHKAANNFQIAAPFGGIAFDAQMRMLTWPQTRARVGPALEVLELSIVVRNPTSRHGFNSSSRSRSERLAQVGPSCRSHRTATTSPTAHKHCSSGDSWRSDMRATSSASDVVSRSAPIPAPCCIRS